MKTAFFENAEDGFDYPAPFGRSHGPGVDCTTEQFSQLPRCEQISARPRAKAGLQHRGEPRVRERRLVEQMAPDRIKKPLPLEGVAPRLVRSVRRDEVQRGNVRFRSD